MAGSMNGNINVDSTMAGSMNDNINVDSTMAGSMNDNINVDSTMAGSMNARGELTTSTLTSSILVYESIIPKHKHVVNVVYVRLCQFS
jgi:hypothetical protein